MLRRLLYGLTVGVLVGAAVVSALLPARPALAEGAAGPKVPRDEPAPSPAPGSDAAPQVRVTPKMQRYSRIRYALYFAGTLLHLAALLLLLRFRVSARLRELAEARGANGLLRAYIYYPLFTLAYGLLTLPLTLYAGFLLPREYGLSNQSFAGYVLDGLKGFGVSSVLGPPVVALLYWTISRSPRKWWLGFWVALIPLLVVSIWLEPLLIAPLFNKFQPLRNVELRDRILALAHTAGIERSRVFEVDASKRTKAVNAYVTGIGGSARIVMWDTTLERLNEEETLFIVAHEMGHYVERHVPLGVAVAIAGSFVCLLLADRGSRALISRHGARWGVREIGDLASLPALLLVVTLLNFFGDPAAAAFSRTLEERADDFALRTTSNGKVGASAFKKLAELNLSDPDPPRFVVLWMFSHPPLNERIRKCLEYPAKALPSGEGPPAP